MTLIKDKVQINIPFQMLWDSYIDRFVELGLNMALVNMAAANN